MVPCITVPTNVKGRFDEYVKWFYFFCFSLHVSRIQQSRWEKTLNNLRREMSPEAYINLVQCKRSYIYCQFLKNLNVSKLAKCCMLVTFIPFYCSISFLIIWTFSWFSTLFTKKKNNPKKTQKNQQPTNNNNKTLHTPTLGCSSYFPKTWCLNYKYQGNVHLFYK